MAHKFNREVEIRSALIHLNSIVTNEVEEEGREEALRSQEAIDRLAKDLGEIYGIDLSLERGDSYGEIEYLRWAVGGCQTLLGYESDEEMEEALNIDSIDGPDDDCDGGSIEVDQEWAQFDSDGFCNTCGDQECEHATEHSEDCATSALAEVRIIVEIPLGWYETYGTGTLPGVILSGNKCVKYPEGKNHLNLPLSEVSEVHLVYHETSLSWKEKNGGPHLSLVPEYVMRLFMEDLLHLLNKGIKITSEVKIENPR